MGTDFINGDTKSRLGHAARAALFCKCMHACMHAKIREDCQADREDGVHDPEVFSKTEL